MTASAFHDVDPNDLPLAIVALAADGSVVFSTVVDGPCVLTIPGVQETGKLVARVLVIGREGVRSDEAVDPTTGGLS